MKTFIKLSFSALLTANIICAEIGETKVRFEQLPTAVQKAVKEQTQSATLKSLSKEVEDGKTVYEVETVVNGKTRDVLLDKSGAVVEVEQEVTLASIPAAAQEAIRKKTAGGKIKKVELLTRGAATNYEAAYVTRSGKNAEFSVNADGSVHK